MECSIYCLVDAGGHIYVKDGAASHAEVATEFGLDQDACDRYRFDLADRRLLVDHGKPASDQAARAYIDRWVGTPEKLMKFAREGRLPKAVLMSLLSPDKAKPYLEACAVIEKRFTEECTAAADPCLEPGCAVEGEICLQPLLRAEVDYRKACGTEWSRLFEDPRHRAETWRN